MGRQMACLRVLAHPKPFQKHFPLDAQQLRWDVRRTPSTVTRRKVRFGSDSDFGEWRTGVRFHLESGPDLAQPIRLISANCRH